MTDRETYLARAAEARADADAALLDNVRNRCLRSEKAWSDMANRAERTEKMRATLEADKAALVAGAKMGDEPEQTGQNLNHHIIAAPQSVAAVEG
jgi:hypothetical protein